MLQFYLEDNTIAPGWVVDSEQGVKSDFQLYDQVGGNQVEYKESSQEAIIIIQGRNDGSSDF